MKINNKFNIAQDVSFGPYIGKITGIIIAPNCLIYKISYFNKDEQYCTTDVYEFEIGTINTAIGFKSK